MTAFNVADRFVDRHVLEGRGNRVAYSCGGRQLTYAQLRELASRSGNAFLEAGIVPGDRILVVCLDAPEFLGAFWGAIKIGAVPVPVSTLLRTPDFLHFLNDSGARAAVVSAPLLPEVGPAIGGAPGLRTVFVAGGDAGPHTGFEAANARAGATLDNAATSAEDTAFWLYSSGSTGAPKGVVHRHRDMVVCYERFARHILDISAADRVFSVAKLFFAYGLGNSGYFPLGAGAEAVLHPARPTPESVLELLARERITLFFGVPTLYAAMLATGGPDLPALRLCVSAGEALPADVHRRWRERFGVEIVDGLGTTEMLHIFLSNRPGASRPGSSGLPVPGYEVAVVDDEGRPVARGEIGNLRVKGDSTMACYWNQPEKTGRALRGAWLETGDKYRQDEDGYFWFCGRGDDMLKVGGIWVSPFEVEATLVEHPAVLEAAVVGREDEARLVKPQAFVVLREPHTRSAALAEELQRFVKGRLAAYKYPRWVEFVDELPKTATGKIQRFKLRTAGE